MMWFAKRDRGLDDFAEAIRPELATLRTPVASNELRDRILTDRAAGVRVILPAERVGRRPMTRYPIAIVLLIAAFLAIPVYRASRDDMPVGQPATQLLYFGGVARAQTPPAAPRLPAAFPAHPERVRAGTLEYLRVWQDSTGRVTKKVRGLLSITAEDSAWRVVEIGRDAAGDGRVTTAETLTVARRDLRLLTRVIHVRPYRKWNGINIDQRITGDSVNGRMTLDDVKGMRPIARRLPPAYAPYLADVFAPVYLSTIPLHRQWEGRVTLIGWAVVPNDVLFPVELRVTGEENVQVPAGRFDCWKLDVRYPGGDFVYWVRKSDGIAVRVVEQQRDGGQRTVNLEREGRM